MLRRIGRYELIERIAAGGQGTVYRARDTVLDRVVAVIEEILGGNRLSPGQAIIWGRRRRRITTIIIAMK